MKTALLVAIAIPIWLAGILCIIASFVVQILGGLSRRREARDASSRDLRSSIDLAIWLPPTSPEGVRLQTIARRLLLADAVLIPLGIVMLLALGRLR